MKKATAKAKNVQPPEENGSGGPPLPRLIPAPGVHLAAAATAAAGEDFALGSVDEVRVFNEEGEDEERDADGSEELRDALFEDKSSLILETELAIKQEGLLSAYQRQQGRTGPSAGGGGSGPPLPPLQGRRIFFFSDWNLILKTWLFVRKGYPRLL